MSCFFRGVLFPTGGDLLVLLVTCVFVRFRLYVQWRFMRGVEAQFLALQKGFNELIPQSLLRPFDERELEVSSLTLCRVVFCHSTKSWFLER